MADFTPITTSKVRSLFVEVPEIVKDIEVIQGNDVVCGLLQFNQRNGEYVKLPPGSYTLLFTTNDATEQQAGEVVEKDYFDGVGYMYANYTLDRKWTFGKTFYTALASLRTLMIAHGLDVKKNYCVLKIN